jgi:thiol-disulfide isomerase/thioredoxin
MEKILNGQVKEAATCVVKFYSNDCHFCHALSGYYQDLSEEEEFSDVHFFAFNLQDKPTLEAQMSFKGVPTISIIKTTETNKPPRIRIMPDPDPPNQKTWYYSKDIKEFINKEK